MKFMFAAAFFLFTCSSALAAKSKDHWYKVEPKKDEKSKEIESQYPYDSVEKQAPNNPILEIGFWSLRPKVSLSGGFHADKTVFTQRKSNRWFFSPQLRFRVRPWHRISTGVLLLQNNSMFVMAAWELMPSRKRIRDYYGIGLAHRLVSEKEFANLVEGEAFHLTGTYGVEYLLESGHALNLEAKAFLSSDNYVIQASAGYIIPF